LEFSRLDLETAVPQFTDDILEERLRTRWRRRLIERGPPSFSTVPGQRELGNDEDAAASILYGQVQVVFRIGWIVEYTEAAHLVGDICDISRAVILFDAYEHQQAWTNPAHYPAVNGNRCR
jgi:hypothetical protein